jgi:hypothetical protein
VSAVVSTGAHQEIALQVFEYRPPESAWLSKLLNVKEQGIYGPPMARP